jgi:hypothetical protein
MMRALAIFLLLFLSAGAHAADGPYTVMFLGNDTFAFHLMHKRRPVLVETEELGDDDFIIDRLFPDMNEELPFSVGRAEGINTALAVIHKGERYIIHDALFTSTAGHAYSPKRFLVFAHEAGHHVCEHVQSSDRVRRGEMELEADQYAGYLLGKISAKRKGDQFVDEWQFLPSHSLVISRAQRMAALNRGIENSPCPHKKGEP